ncbi:aldo/keto reductase [Streptomyces fuscichromogenes]|uniref:aldo/keto reductase n=1 Tax=Streptomyces fuscichromogenes TaxID=1324013 RepID=UPI0016710DE6|nr:aldo/keto reductase [Streptomyces fuscichromogenes]
MSRIALGTATFGVSPLVEHAADYVRFAVDLGVTHIDTANSYGSQPDYDRPGLPSWRERDSAEEIIGNAVRGLGERITVATKVGELLGDARSSQPWQGRLDPAHIMEQAHSSLRRLSRDRIDVYYAHLPDPTTPILETIAAFDSLIRSGDVGCWGVANYSATELEDLSAAALTEGLHPPVVTQVHYNAANRDVEADLVPTVRRRGMGLVAYSPLAMGLLSGEASAARAWSGSARWGGERFSPAEVAVAGRFETAAQSLGLSAAQAAIAWLLHQRDVSAAAVGATSPAHLQDAVDGAAATLTPAGLKTLERALIGATSVAHLDTVQNCNQTDETDSLERI